MIERKSKVYRKGEKFPRDNLAKLGDLNSS